MTDKNEVVRSLYEITGNITDHNTVLVNIAELETLRTGYAAARLEIESLKAQLHAAKQINAAQFWLFTSSIPGSALRVSHWQAPAQAAPQQGGVCDKAPAGWLCTRQHGHEGPCAAEPTLSARSDEWVEGYAAGVRDGWKDALRTQQAAHTPQEDGQPSPAALDAARLDWLESDAGCRVFHLGKSWYTRANFGMPYRKQASLREAIDAAIAAQEGK